VAAGNDIYYKTFPRPDVEKRVKLSFERDKSVAEQVARMLSAFKGSGGKRFYVNEFCSVFSPISGREGLEYLYIGQLDLQLWFPNPVASAMTDDRDGLTDGWFSCTRSQSSGSGHPGQLAAQLVTTISSCQVFSGLIKLGILA